MPNNWKYIAARISIGLLLTLVLVVSYFLGKNQFNKTRCKDIQVTVTDSLTTRFVTEQIIKDYLAEDYKDLIGKPLSKIDLMKVENILRDKITIEDCNAYVTGDGYLNVSVSQRKPSIRLHTPDSTFYCDKNGNVIPIQPTFAADVPIIDGHIPMDTTGRPQAEWLRNIVATTQQIESSKVWGNAISQIHCNEKGDLVIVTKVGEEKFIFGHPTDVNTKLDKMQIYYEMIAKDGKRKYDIVDLRFDKQIICKNNK